MEREPMESLSTRVGREAMAMAASSVALSSVDGLIVGRMPGVKVAGANTCFMVEVDAMMGDGQEILWLCVV